MEYVVQIERTLSNKQFRSRFESTCYILAAGYFAEPYYTVVVYDLYDCPQGIGSVQARSIQKGRIFNCYRSNSYILNMQKRLFRSALCYFLL